MGMRSLALTDVNGVSGVVRFQQVCREAGIKPIFGSEVSVLGRWGTGDGRRGTGDGRRGTGDGRRETGDGGRETGDGGWRTGDKNRRARVEECIRPPTPDPCPRS